MPTFYTHLQIEPQASQEEIAAAYERLSAQYTPERLAQLAPELRELAERRHASIEQAYRTLGDAERRAAYDAQMSDGQPAVEEIIDYRPLGGVSSSVRSIAAPADTRRQRKLQWSAFAALLLAVAIGTLALTHNARQLPVLTADEMRAIAAESRSALPPEVAAEITDPVVADMLAQQQALITERRQIAEQSKRAEDWTNYGNILFDYLELIRQQTKEGNGYKVVAPGWLDAIQAYTQALQFNPRDGLVRSDFALSLLRYGQFKQDDQFIASALAEADQALKDDQSPRTKLNVGLVLLTNKERSAEGRALLESLAADAPDTPEAQAAAQILSNEVP